MGTLPMHAHGAEDVQSCSGWIACGHEKPGRHSGRLVDGPSLPYRNNISAGDATHSMGEPGVAGAHRVCTCISPESRT